MLYHANLNHINLTYALLPNPLTLAGKQLSIDEASYVLYEADHAALHSLAVNSSYVLDSNWLQTVEVRSGPGTGSVV
jgi:hypothetical protein